MRLFLNQFALMVLVQAMVSSASFADFEPMDVNGNQNHYLKVTNFNGQVKFEECFKKSNPTCARTLGPHEWYSIQELHSERATQTWQAYGSIGADVLLVAAAVYGGAFAGASLAGASATSTGFFGGMFETLGGALLGGGVGGAGVVTAIAFLDPINPVEQFKQAGTLSKEVIYDQPVLTPNLDRFIQRLELVLKEL